MQLRHAVLLATLSLYLGCASASPPWHEGFLDSLDEYYDQGTGGGPSREQADRNARVSLLGYREGIHIGNVTQDQVQSYVEDGDEMIVEMLSSRGVERVSGTLPPKAQIAERYRDRFGAWWSYAVVEKSGAERLIQSQRNRRLGAARLRSMVPGWSQFTKAERGKGMRIIVAEGIGLAGLATFAILQADFKDRRDRVRGIGLRARDDRQWYDDWANRFYWSGMACGALAGATYLYSLVDGLTHIPPTYKLLLSKAHLQAGPGSLALVFQQRISRP